jgi:peptidoglycan/LPS O-acetylase OafA/YrhL
MLRKSYYQKTTTIEDGDMKDPLSEDFSQSAAASQVETLQILPKPPALAAPVSDEVAIKPRRRGIRRFTDLIEPHQQKGSILALDGVRAIACLIVIGYHISLIGRSTYTFIPTQQPVLAAFLLAGESGVTLFFVLSGFLLFLPYARALLSQKAWPSMRRFYVRRALRIIPAYYACLFILILLTHREYFQPDHWKQLAIFLIFFMDSTPATYQAINGPFWTLAVEWQFYLLLPLLALGIRALAWRCSPARRLWCIVACLLAVIAWGMASQAWVYGSGPQPLSANIGLDIVDVVLFGQLGKFLQDFAVGMLVSLLFTFAADHERVKNALYKWSPWLFGAGIALLTFIAFWRENAVHNNGAIWLTGLRFAFNACGEVGFALGFALAVVAILAGVPIFQKVFAWSPLRWIGNVSYSTYMWHFPLLLFFRFQISYLIVHWNVWLIFGSYWLWVGLVILPFSLLLFMLTERPGMQISNRLWQRRG